MKLFFEYIVKSALPAYAIECQDLRWIIDGSLAKGDRLDRL
jgi:hypothetical protein